MRVGTFPAPLGAQTGTESREAGANTPLLRIQRQTPLWRLGACAVEVYTEVSSSRSTEEVYESRWRKGLDGWDKTDAI